MIEEFFNGMITLLLTKFMLNDVPHAAGMLGKHTWVEAAWNDLCDFLATEGRDLRGAVQQDLGENGLSTDAVNDLKIVTSGYFLIAIGEASNEVVNDVYNLLNSGIPQAKEGIASTAGMSYGDFLEKAIHEYGPPTARPGTDWGLYGVILGVEAASRLFINGARADKVIAIDAVMTIQHVTEGVLQFILPHGLTGQNTALVIADMLTILGAQE